MRYVRYACLFATTIAAGAPNCAALAQDAAIPEQDHPAPFDYGFGPGVRVGDRQLDIWNRVADAILGRGRTPIETEQAIEAMPPGSFGKTRSVHPSDSGYVDPGVGGEFSYVLPWPIIPLHMALMPDGRVLNYGTDENGKQGAELYYDIWDPTVYYGVSHTVLANTTSTDIFCSGMGLLPNGSLLITGGDLTINKKRNYSNNQATVFTPSTNALTANGTMTYPRWYPADVPLPTGDHLIVGGRSNQKPTVPVGTPEYYSAALNTFTPLPGAATPNSISWYYPKAFVTSSGALEQVDKRGTIISYTTSGNGSVTTMPVSADVGLDDLPTIMYQPSQLLSIRKSNFNNGDEESYTFDNIDLRGAAPVVTQLPGVPGEGREWSNMTELADGTIWVNGGSGVSNALTEVSMQSYLYNPATQGWTAGAIAQEARLYHSASLLLPDATVISGGGGAPGPVSELNGEIYYPPYLFNHDGSGTFANRPVITSAPGVITAGASFDLLMGDAGPVSAVNLVRIGAVTHSTSLQTRFIAASFSQNGNDVTVQAPANTNDFLTGYWMIFVFNSAGVPAYAPIVQVPLAEAPNAVHGASVRR